MTPLHHLLLYYKGTNEEADDETNSKSPIIRDNNYYRFMDFGSLNCTESALCVINYVASRMSSFYSPS